MHHMNGATCTQKIRKAEFATKFPNISEASSLFAISQEATKI